MKHEILIVCDCSSSEHQLIIRKWSDEDDIYVSVHLSKQSLLRRIKLAFKYIFGYQCKYGAFEEVILTKDNTKQLYEMLKDFHELPKKSRKA